MHDTRLWISLAFVLVASFAVLVVFGWDIAGQAPPVPARVVTTDTTLVWTGQDIKDGQNVWQSLGGQEVGSIWGHGAYVAFEAAALLPNTDPLLGLMLMPSMQATHKYFWTMAVLLVVQVALAFLQTDVMHTLRWLRVIDDTLFALGIPALGWFILGLKTGWSLTDTPQHPPQLVSCTIL